ncbi:LLM class flavin-dependent oxidoreductase [Alkalihalobacillus sp. MEB130]|uniref:LLM class flavin-dependent oxidoreductase n=1 Tax=Alkalihalobacillus sp. MEB130 TaxID=2976704 RepID=UPI0028DF6A1F|nr:LLM class flavin-dependent oxidoreductase [Alkalihalobacillus sp. MEB130]MDT8861193.1 LLM class flavin-dependent oxidoreductase [Alkalihalobacillus sp. MEB130]
MRISVLDQAPISSNQTSSQALIEALKLAKAAEDLGYARYWIAEHHDLPGLACSAPEVMLGYIGAHTDTIRIGSGAVLLPHYKPYKVAEVYNTLASLFPGRVDVGIGRAPGGSAEATNALSDHFLQNVFQMPTSVRELIHFLDDDFPHDHKYTNVSAAPVPDISPEPWLLGTSKKSALLAAEYGMAYAFGLFMSDRDGQEIINLYRENYKARKKEQKSEVILTVSVICADTVEKAEELALSHLIWKLQTEKGEGREGVPSINQAKSYPMTDQDKRSLQNMKKNIIIGDTEKVRKELCNLKETYDFDELMIVTITYDPNDRIRSYELLAEIVQQRDY